MISDINRSLMLLTKRADQQVPAILYSTFVDAGVIKIALSSIDHAIIYGRRGTGKTHALAYAAEDINRTKPLAIFRDFRSIGSDTSVYNAPEIPIEQRATRLLLDVIGSCQDQLVTFALEKNVHPSALGLLDELADQIATVRVEGVTEVESRTSGTQRSGKTESMKASLGVDEAVAGFKSSNSREKEMSSSRSQKATGTVQAHVHFGGVSNALSKVIDALGIPRLWFLFDEWSAIPSDLQPLLADFIRRALLPCAKVTVKIGAIEQRSNFFAPLPNGEYLGFELGADMGSSTNLDDIMVFAKDEQRAIKFFSLMFFGHLNAQFAESGNSTPKFHSLEDFIAKTFTQENAFKELVRAAEGVSRDAIYIASHAAQKADQGKISINDVRNAAREHFQRDKEKNIPPDARKLLDWAVHYVIRGRKARAFLLERGPASEHPLIRQLFDCRVLHIVKRGISSKVEAGKRFDVYAIDYGCYVELLTTADNPSSLFQDDDGNAVEVPLDDYRSIRRAVLDLNEFEKSLAGK